MKLLVRNLPRTLSEDQLQEMFAAFGVVQSCKLVMDNKSGLSKGFAFVEMPRPGDAKAATKQLNGREVNGLKIRVKKAEPRPASGPDEKASTERAPSPWKKS